MKPWILYSLLRLLLFVVPFAALMLLGWHWIAALAVSTLAAISLSVIFLHRLRSDTSEQIYAWRTQDRTADDVAEDAEIGVTDEHLPGVSSDQAEGTPSAAPEDDDVSSLSDNDSSSESR